MRLPSVSSTAAADLRHLAKESAALGDITFAAICFDLAGADEELLSLVRHCPNPPSPHACGVWQLTSRMYLAPVWLPVVAIGWYQRRC